MSPAKQREIVSVCPLDIMDEFSSVFSAVFLFVAHEKNSSGKSEKKKNLKKLLNFKTD